MHSQDCRSLVNGSLVFSNLLDVGLPIAEDLGKPRLCLTHHLESLPDEEGRRGDHITLKKVK